MNCKNLKITKTTITSEENKNKQIHNINKYYNSLY